MSKRKISLLLALTSTATAFCFLAFVNNIAAIVNWWRGFLSAGGDSSRFSAKATGIIPWLDWSAVDYSAVTTFIPTLGFLCLSLSLVRMLRGRPCRPADFPFFRGSDQLNVALGLFGTLWGIIVIGYFNLDTVSMADLMQCLHTALFSTLMAVVWVFMIDRALIRPYFLKLLAATNLGATDKGDLSAAVERLVERLDAASASFDARQRAFEATFADRQTRYEKLFQDRIASFESEAVKRSEAYRKMFESHFAAFEQAVVERQTAERKDYEARLARYEASAVKVLETFRADFEARQNAYAADFEKRLADYESAFAARQQEYQEFFLRRIGELEKVAAEEKARGDRLAEKLAAVTDALR